ncbi:MAG: hypothetical protein B7Y43_18840 [Sphingomonas sp. 28-62-20]|uniref:hypothetical protein n=1 Tax=Sphingomonas sp. 28-62-20 TaxID=1970433 RepID=UPI000BC44BAC|nr:MAG: hypothetical protein B7Y43_18840 [Sphingomonas sp. 28-62-20]
MIKPIHLAASALLLSASALAQTPDPHAGHAMPGAATAPPPPMDHAAMPGMDHSQMDMPAPPASDANAMPAMDHSAMPGMDHSKMDMPASPGASDSAMPGMDHSKMNHGGMAMTPAPKGITRHNVGPAEAALQAFSDALEVGNSDLAIACLAPGLKVVEDGAEESRAEYVGGHLAADIAYQKSVKTVLLERSVINESPAQTRIVSKLRMVSNRSDKMIDTLVDETAVLQKLPGGWKIVLLKWDSAK